MRSEAGFPLLELLMALMLSVVLFLAVMMAYSQANSIKAHTQGTVTVQANVRIAIDRMERECRCRLLAKDLRASPRQNPCHRLNSARFHPRGNGCGESELMFRSSRLSMTSDPPPTLRCGPG